MREEDVVVLGQEARRRGRLRVWSGRVGEVEQLTASLVAERDQARPQTLDDLAQPCEARPRGDVGDGRGPEGAEVAQDHVVERGLGLERAAQPRLGRRRDRLRGLAPDASRRHLDEGEQVAARVGEVGGVVLWESLGERRA